MAGDAKSLTSTVLWNASFMGRLLSHNRFEARLKQSALPQAIPIYVRAAGNSSHPVPRSRGMHASSRSRCSAPSCESRGWLRLTTRQRLKTETFVQDIRKDQISNITATKIAFILGSILLLFTAFLVCEPFHFTTLRRSPAPAPQIPSVPDVDHQSTTAGNIKKVQFLFRLGHLCE